MNSNLKKKEEKEKETTKANVTIAPKSTHSILFEYNIYIKTTCTGSNRIPTSFF